MRELQAILSQLERESLGLLALATLVRVQGSSYRRVGARLLVNADGQWLGSISGGCLESDVIARAQEVLADGEAQLAVYDTTDENDLVWGTGMKHFWPFWRAGTRFWPSAGPTCRACPLTPPRKRRPWPSSAT